MKIPLSPRLLSCAGFVHPGDRVADIGCDHGYLGIYLLQEGIASSVISADINEGPLRNAYHNAHKYGVADKMHFYLSNGLRNVPQDFDVVVCAGMGAETMISILEAAPWLRSNRYRLILQCQTKTYLLRRYLSEQGWIISREPVLQDGKFLYTQMEVLWDPINAPLSPGQCYLSPAMLLVQTEEVLQHSRWIYDQLSKIVAARGDCIDPWIRQAYLELTQYSFLKEETL